MGMRGLLRRADLPRLIVFALVLIKCCLNLLARVFVDIAMTWMRVQPKALPATPGLEIERAKACEVCLRGHEENLQWIQYYSRTRFGMREFSLTPSALTESGARWPEYQIETLPTRSSQSH